MTDANESTPWDIVQSTLAREFSGATDVERWTEMLVRLSIAMFLAGVLGYDRERKRRPAGLRTHLMVGLGAATLALIPEQLGFSDEAMARVIEGVIAGIGFLGAGAIIRVESPEQVRGLTTAGSIWATAAVGVAAGLGQEITALVTTAFAFLILSWISRIEMHVGSTSSSEENGQVITPETRSTRSTEARFGSG